MSIKISIIGAGSAVFSLNMIRDLCLTPNLRGSTVTFMDINPQRLEAAYTLCTRYAEEVGIQLRLEKTLDRREALRGADYVINSALAAGHDRLRAGWEIGKKHGYRFGGSLHFMHDEAFYVNFYQYRLFESIIRDVLELCPNAWYIQIANPVFAGITLLGRKYPQAKIVGLCHGFGGVYHLAEVLGLDAGQISFELPGVNHFLWLHRLFHKGEDAMPRLRAWVAEEAEAYCRTCGISNDVGPKSIDLFKRFGAFPIGDTCTVGGGSWGWWYHMDDVTEKRWQEDPASWWEGYFKGGEQGVEHIRQVAADRSRRVTDEFKAEHSHESIITLVESLACDVQRVIISNIMNRGGLVPGMPEDCSVEVPALVSGHGIQGIQTHPLPEMVQAYLLRDRIAPMNLELAAYEQGSRELLVELIRMDPWTRTEDQARQVVEEILALPFHAEMQAHYR